MRISFFIALASACIAGTASYRILAFFPLPAKSHHFVFRPVIEELAKRGHEVVYVTAYPYDEVPKNITQINFFQYLLPIMGEKKTDMVAFGELMVPASIIALYEIGLHLAPIFVGNPMVQEIIHSNEKFDAVLIESYFVQEYLSAFVHKFGAVGIEIMPLGDCGWVNEMSALPDNPSYQIDFKNENTNELSFFGRLYNCYVQTCLTVLGYFYVWRMQGVVDTYFNYTGWEDRPPLSQLASNRSLVLTNSHYILGYPSPSAPHRKEIGGINIKPNKPLPKDIQKFMDDAEHGVIYMSLGSNINVSDVASSNLREEFMKVFKGLRQRVLMKWETEYQGELPANVKLSSWFPQQDILAHKKLVLFITHGGILSISESVYHGVPLIGIPFFGDQVKNMIQVQSTGYGRMLRYRNLTMDTISWNINEVLSNPRYKKEVLRRSEIFRDTRHSPTEEAAYWVEYAIKYPNALTPKGAFLPFYALHLWDIYLFLLVVFLALSWVSCKISFKVLSLFKKKEKKVKTN